MQNHSQSTSFKLAKYNRLNVIKIVHFGYYLDGGDLGEILLPNKNATETLTVGQTIDAFLYLDSEDRLIATMKKNLPQAGEFAYLKVSALGKIGAFLEWGLEKHLLLPFAQQVTPVMINKSYLVHIYINHADGRIVASTKIDRFVENDAKNADYQQQQTVNLMIAGTTPLGFRAIVDHQYWGVLYQNEVFQKLRIGQSLKGHIKNIRADGKLDLCLNQNGRKNMDQHQEKIINLLQKNQGFSTLNDKTPAHIIYEQLGMSKSTFKQAIGALFKKQQIAIQKDGIRLLDNSSS